MARDKWAQVVYEPECCEGTFHVFTGWVEWSPDRSTLYIGNNADIPSHRVCSIKELQPPQEASRAIR